MFGAKKRKIAEQEKRINALYAQNFMFAANLDWNEYRDKKKDRESLSLKDELAQAKARIDALISHVDPEASV